MNRRFTKKELSDAKEIGAETLRTHHHAALQAASRPLDRPRGRVCGYDRDWASKAPVLGNQGKPGAPSPPTP